MTEVPINPRFLRLDCIKTREAWVLLNKAIQYQIRNAPTPELATELADFKGKFCAQLHKQFGPLEPKK